MRYGLRFSRRSGFWPFRHAGRESPSRSHLRSAAVPRTGPEPPEPLRDEIPPAELSAVMAAHFKGLGYMERYEYGEAVEAFREVHRRAPGWIPARSTWRSHFLNDSGVKAEQAKKAGGEAALRQFRRGPRSAGRRPGARPGEPVRSFLPGHHPRAAGADRRGASAFQERDRDRPQRRGGLVLDGQHLDRSRRTRLSPPGPKQAKEQIALLAQSPRPQPLPDARDLQDGDGLAVHQDPKKTKELFERWKKMNPDRPDPSPGPGDSAEKKYGEMGKYASVINPFPRTRVDRPRSRRSRRISRPPSRCRSSFAEGERWVKPSDFTGSRAVIGRVRARFGAAVAAFDADGDGRLDLFLASAVVGPKGVHDVLLLNKGEGRFEDASATFGLPEDRASLGVAAADFDADRHIDVFLTGVGGNRLLRNRDGKTFEDISSTLKPVGPPALSLMARWLDLDQDGDLDLYVVNYCAAEHADKAFVDSGDPPPGLANAVYRNDGQPDPASGATLQGRTPVATAYGEAARVAKGLTLALTPWPEAGVARWRGESPHRDRPARHRQRPRPRPGADRGQDTAGRHPQRSPGPVPRSGHSRASPTVDQVSGILATDFDSDGRTDLVAACSNGRVVAWRNTTERTTAEATRPAFESWPINAANWRQAQAIDLDLDGLPDLLGTAGRLEQAGRNALARLGTQRRESLRGGDLAAGACRAPVSTA